MQAAGMKTSSLPVVSLWALFLSTALLSAEEVTIRQSAVLKAERTMVSLKAGTVVELVSRDGDIVTIRYKNLTGQIPAAKLEEAKPAATKPEAAKPQEDKPDNPPARPPQTGYGKAVQKAKDNAKAHEKSQVEPTDEILK